jgi:hypothetical protein
MNDPNALRTQRQQLRTARPERFTRGDVFYWLSKARRYRICAANRVDYHDSLSAAEGCISGVRPVRRGLKPLP